MRWAGGKLVGCFFLARFVYWSSEVLCNSGAGFTINGAGVMYDWEGGWVDSTNCCRSTHSNTNMTRHLCEAVSYWPNPIMAPLAIRCDHSSYKWRYYYSSVSWEWLNFIATVSTLTIGWDALETAFLHFSQITPHLHHNIHICTHTLPNYSKWSNRWLQEILPTGGGQPEPRSPVWYIGRG